MPQLPAFTFRHRYLPGCTQTRVRNDNRERTPPLAAAAPIVKEQPLRSNKTPAEIEALILKMREDKRKELTDTVREHLKASLGQAETKEALLARLTAQE